MCVQDVDRLKKGVYIRSYTGQLQPLAEFRLAANAQFLALLQSYREAVVAKIMAPDIHTEHLVQAGGHGRWGGGGVISVGGWVGGKVMVGVGVWGGNIMLCVWGVGGGVGGGQYHVCVCVCDCVCVWGRGG